MSFGTTVLMKGIAEEINRFQRTASYIEVHFFIFRLTIKELIYLRG